MNQLPRVSICLPNLNTRRFLPARLDSIFAQTFSDWELLIYDSFSSDGSWEYLNVRAAGDPRIKLWQGPPEGIYPAWNACVVEAKGEYVYIATSDDTMVPQCLEKMVAALDGNLDCGYCQCNLVLIDEESKSLESAAQWSEYSLAHYNRDLITRKNVRRAPHDGLLHPALYTIYTSITQLLIRKSTFNRIGLFDGRWGSISDFEWGMRAGLLVNCLAIPEELATWRVHSKQATQEVHTIPVRKKMEAMCRAAFAKAALLGSEATTHIDVEDFVYFLSRDIILFEQRRSRGLRKYFHILPYIFRNPRALFTHLFDQVRGRKWDVWHSDLRCARLGRLLRKYNVPAPYYP